MTELLHDNNKVKAAIAREAHTTTKYIELMEATTIHEDVCQKETYRVSAIIGKNALNLWFKGLSGAEDWQAFDVFQVNDNRLEAVKI